MKLTEKQIRFIDYYIETGNATESAKKAGYKGKNLNRIGSENLSKLDSEINTRLLELSSERIASANEVMEYLTAVMRREHKEVIVVTLTKEKSTYAPDSNGTMRKQTFKEEIPELVEIPAKLSDANKAAELLGKRYRLFTDKVEIEGATIVQIVDDINDQ